MPMTTMITGMSNINIKFRTMCVQGHVVDEPPMERVRLIC